MMPPVVVYIISPGHSGSTLLDLLLASHSQVTTIGEAKVLSPRRPRPGTASTCTCGAPGLHHCPFWSAVDARLARTLGLSLDRLDVDIADPAAFALHNRALMEAVAALSGRHFIVDSSKSPERLARLLSVDGLVVLPVQLRRDPRGVVYSHVKKGRAWARYALAYGRHYARADRVLRGRNAYRLRYETLASNPADAVAGVMSWLGLTFEPQQLSWKTREHHSVEGNHMRLEPARGISLDEQWRSGLSFHQRLGALWLSRLGRITPDRRAPASLEAPVVVVR